MKMILVSFLLLFELCSGFSLRNVQSKLSLPPTPERPTETYDVEEGASNTIRLLYPKSEKPTLREIVYYHLVETPYDVRDDIKSTPKIDTIDPADPNLSYLDDDVGSPEGTDETKVGSKDDGTKTVQLDVRDKGQAASNNSKESDQVMELEDVDMEYPEDEDPEDEVRTARNILFDQAKSKYKLKRQSKSSRRNKRGITSKSLPPPPILPPLNLGRFPEYIRRLVSVAKSESPTAIKDELAHFNEEDFEEELKRKIDDTISASKIINDDDDDNKDDSDDDNGSDDDEDDDDNDEYYDNYEDDDDPNDDDNDKKPATEHNTEEELAKKQIPRTFGMNLTMGQGYVWNDLVSEPGKPGISFDVDQPHDISDNTRDEVTDRKESSSTKRPENESAKPDTQLSSPSATGILEFSEIFTNIPPLTESRPVHIEEPDATDTSHSNNEQTHSDDKDNKREDDMGKPDEGSSDNEDLEDIAVFTFNKKRKLLIDDKNLFEKDDDRHDLNEGDNKDKDDKKNKAREEKATDPNMSKNNEEDEKKKKPGRKSPQTHNKHHASTDKSNQKAKIFENDDALKELMKDEQFWKWLSDWTTTYMKLLMKHIKGLVHDEVSRQIKSLNPIKNSTPEDKIDVKENEGETNEKYDDRDNSYDNKEIHYGNIIFEGKEIPITHNTNFDLNNGRNDITLTKFDGPEEQTDDAADFLKHKKAKSKRKEFKNKESKRKPPKVITSNKDENKSSSNVSANNIFGNAVGSDKVTNIFIFYPKEHNDKTDDVGILTGFQPSKNDSELNGTDDNFQIDKRHPDLTSLKEESTIEDSNKSTQKLQQNETPNNNHEAEKSEKSKDPQTDASKISSRDEIKENGDNNETSTVETKREKENETSIVESISKLDESQHEVKIPSKNSVNGTNYNFQISEKHPDITELKDESTMTEEHINKTTEKPQPNETKNNNETNGSEKHHDSQTESSTTKAKNDNKTENGDEKQKSDTPSDESSSKSNELKHDEKNEPNKENKAELTTENPTSDSKDTEKDPEINKTADNKDKGKSKLDDAKDSKKHPVTESNNSTDNKMEVESTTVAYTDKIDQSDKLEDKLAEEKAELKAAIAKELKADIETEIARAIQKELDRAVSEIEKKLSNGNTTEERKIKEDGVASEKDSDKKEEGNPQA